MMDNLLAVVMLCSLLALYVRFDLVAARNVHHGRGGSGDRHRDPHRQHPDSGAHGAGNQHELQTMSGGDNLTTFMYFAYGSNLLTKRIHIQNPTARRVTIGKLDGYRLDFMTQSNRWHGASATIVEEDGAVVWGAIWQIDISNLESLDNQEGVHINIYKPLVREIETIDGELITCRTYQQVSDPIDGHTLPELPAERQPSQTYLQTIRHGAEESRLPADYLALLLSIPDNGNQACAGILANLSD